MRKRFQYAIKVNGRVVWRGLNPKKKFEEIREKNPKKEVGIAWETKEDVLVCIF